MCKPEQHTQEMWNNMVMRLIVVSIILSALAGADARVFLHIETKLTQDEKLYSFVSSALVRLEAMEPVGFYYIAGGIYHNLGVNVSNPGEVKEFTCKITRVQTLRELYDNLQPRGLTYEKLQNSYGVLQEHLTEELGGYTNAPRVVKYYEDIWRWVLKLSGNATNPAEATDLVDLTRFFEVMQVKYGSRWLSFILFSKNQMILTPDPKEAAKELHASKSEEDVMRILNITKSIQARRIYDVVLIGQAHGIRSRSPEPIELAAEAAMVLGDLGLFNLKV